MTWTWRCCAVWRRSCCDMIDRPRLVHRADGLPARRQYAKARLPGSERPAEPEQRRHLRRLGRLRLDPRAAAAGLPAGHVRTADMWGFAESQETVGVSPGDVRGVRLPLPAADPGALRPELLRLLRAAGHALARGRSERHACGGCRSRPGPNLAEDGRATGRPLHLLVEAESRADLATAAFDEERIRAGLREAIRSHARLPGGDHHEGQPHPGRKPPERRALGADRQQEAERTANES